MKIFEFLKKEKKDIETVDNKLERFVRIFETTYHLSVHTKQLFERIGANLAQYQANSLKSLENRVFGQIVNKERLELQVAMVYGRTGNSRGLSREC